MVYKDLTFLLFAKDMGTGAAFEKVSGSADKMRTGVTGSLGMVGLAVAGLGISVAAKSVKMAADFETAVTRIRTDGGGAGESVSKLSKVIMDAGVNSGTSMDTAAMAMYKVSSAGYNLANGGAAVLKAALEGAAIGGADAATVADVLTTTLTDFGPQAGTAAQAMSKLTATVATGKTNLQDLAGSLHSVLPNAAAAGLGLNEVLAAVGTMTAEGISADQATQNLNHSILSLQAPSHVAAAAMAGIGVSSLNVAQNLGKRGLAGTYDYLLTAMAKHSHAGSVVVNAFASSAQASAALKTEIGKLPPALAYQAQAFANNTITSKQWAADLKQYPAMTATLGKQFATTAKHANGFSDALKSGTGTTRTAAAQLEAMLGGITGLQVGLHLTGEHASRFVQNTKDIAAASTEAGGHVRGFAETQKTLNYQLKQNDAAFGAAGVAIGTALMPAIKELMPLVPKIAKGFQDIAPGIEWVASAIAKVMQTDPLVFFGQMNSAIKALDNPVKGVAEALSGKFGPAVKIAAGVGVWFGQKLHDLIGIGNSVVSAFSSIGGHIVSGLVGGIQGAWGAVTGTINSLVNSIPVAVRKLLGIASPSKVFFEIGNYVGQGLQKGLLGSVSQVQGASSTLAGAVIAAFQAKRSTMSAGREHSLLHLITGDERQLSSLAADRANLQKKLGTLTTARTSTVDSTRNATLGYGDITAYPAIGDAVGGLRALVGKTRTFTDDLRSLMKKGVSGAMLTQLVNGWNSNPDTALATANGLLANPTDLKQILGLEAQLSSAAGGLASMAGNAEYGSQIAATSGKIKVDTWRMQQLARNEASRVAGGLHVTVNLAGTYAGTKESLGKSIAQLLRDEVKKGTIPKNWATA